MFIDNGTQRIHRALLVTTAVVLLALVTAACGSTAATAEATAVPTALSAASGNGGVTTVDLVSALEAAGLGTMASAIEQVGDSPLLPAGAFTVLAPSDDAFLTLTSDETADVLSDPALLLQTLQNHVIDGRLSAAELANATAVTTIAGIEHAVATDAGVLTVGGATVSGAEFALGRGVVHVIDAVLVP